MTTIRPALAMDPRSFGRRTVSHATEAPAPTWSADVRLFASTFTVGFVMVTFLIF